MLRVDPGLCECLDDKGNRGLHGGPDGSAQLGGKIEGSRDDADQQRTTGAMPQESRDGERLPHGGIVRTHARHQRTVNTRRTSLALALSSACGLLGCSVPLDRGSARLPSGTRATQVAGGALTSPASTPDSWPQLPFSQWVPGFRTPRFGIGAQIALGQPGNAMGGSERSAAQDAGHFALVTGVDAGVGRCCASRLTKNRGSSASAGRASVA